jgi:hypothetical protein
MVYEHFLGCFISKDPSLRFLELFQVVAIVTYGDIFKSMALVLLNILLIMVKEIGGLCPIVVNEVFL